MTRRLIVLCCTLFATSLLASDTHRKTIFIDRMGGLERWIEIAIAEKEVKVEVLEEEMHPDLKVLLGKKFTSVYAEILYQKQTGRKEESVLKAVEPKTGKTIVEYSFHMSGDNSKKQAAEAFVEALKKKLD